MSTRPVVSIIMNCHNGQKFLSDAIQSVINQSFKNWELIFWDNSSSDNSRNILKSFSDKRIKYFFSNKFCNLYEARNLAVKECKGKYITFLDTDDLWLKDKLDEQINFITKNTNFKIIFSNFYVLDETKNTKKIRHKINLPSGDITQNLLNYYSIGILTVFMEKSIFDSYKFDKDYNIVGDFDFFIALSQIYKIGSVQKPLSIYRNHSSSYSNKRIKIYIDELKSWIKKNEENLKKKGFKITDQKIYLYKLQLKYFFKSFFKF